MISDERLAILLMYAETLATANRIGVAAQMNWIGMVADPAEVVDVLREIQAHRAEKMIQPLPENAN